MISNWFINYLRPCSFNHLSIQLNQKVIECPIAFEKSFFQSAKLKFNVEPGKGNESGKTAEKC